MSSPEGSQFVPDEEVNKAAPERPDRPGVDIGWFEMVINQHPERVQKWLQKRNWNKETFLAAANERFGEGTKQHELLQKQFGTTEPTSEQKMAMLMWYFVQKEFAAHESHSSRTKKLLGWIAPGWVDAMDKDTKNDILP